MPSLFIELNKDSKKSTIEAYNFLMTNLRFRCLQPTADRLQRIPLLRALMSPKEQLKGAPKDKTFSEEK